MEVNIYKIYYFNIQNIQNNNNNQGLFLFIEFKEGWRI